MDRIELIANRLESVVDKLENFALTSGSANNATSNKAAALNTTQSAVEMPPIVNGFDAILSGSFAQFLKLSATIGGDVMDVAKMANDAFNLQRSFLVKAVATPKPGDTPLALLLQPTADQMIAIQNFRESKRKSNFFNHLSAISESIQALGWVQIVPAPAPFIQEMNAAAQFFTNRVLKDYKEKDTTHVEWAKAWLLVLTELQQYVKEYHTTGLRWNAHPGLVSSDLGSAAGVRRSPPKSGLPPPPPLPPPPGFMPSGDASSRSGAGDPHAALFAEINKGMEITRGLKKVTSDMQTHKNPDLKKQTGPPPLPSKPLHLQDSSTTSVSKQQNATSNAQVQPVLRLDGGKKWIVENFKGNKAVVVNTTDMKQVAYIWKCVDSVIQIKNKINSITLDSCKKTSIVFDSLVSSVEVINCQSVQIQTLGHMPTIIIDKTDGCQIFLSKDSLNAEIVSSKSSEMNVCVPMADGDIKEVPIPESFKTFWNGKKLETMPVDITG